jgi:hypothetical protein
MFLKEFNVMFKLKWYRMMFVIEEMIYKNWNDIIVLRMILNINFDLTKMIYVKIKQDTKGW